MQVRHDRSQRQRVLARYVIRQNSLQADEVAGTTAAALSPVDFGAQMVQFGVAIWGYMAPEQVFGEQADARSAGTSEQLECCACC